MGFIKKNWKKGIGDTIANLGCNLGGGAAASFVIKKFFGKPVDGAAKSQTLYNVGGPAVWLTSAIGVAVLENEYLRSVANGMATIAGLHSISVIAPSLAQNFGLQGLESEPETENANNAALMGAAGNVGALSAGDAAEEAFKEVPAAQIQNDGNPWAEIADKIDDPNTTVKVEGVEDAGLMGEETEDAELMGMF